MVSAIERAFQLARSGHYKSFSEIKRALRRDYYVERDLAGRTLAADIGRACKAASAEQPPALVILKQGDPERAG